MVSGQQEALVNARRSLTKRDGETKWIAQERGRGPEECTDETAVSRSRRVVLWPRFPPPRDGNAVAIAKYTLRLRRQRGCVELQGGGGNGCARETRFYQPLITRPKSNVRGAAAGIRLSRDDCGGHYDRIICAQFSADGDTLSGIYFCTPQGKLALVLPSACTAFSRARFACGAHRRTLAVTFTGHFVRSRRHTSTAAAHTHSNEIPEFSPEHGPPARTFLKPFAPQPCYLAVGTPCHRRQKYTSETN